MKSFSFLLAILFCLDFVMAQVVHPIGHGLTMQGIIYDITKDESSGSLYAVGKFSAIDGNRMQNVAKLENGEWSSLGDSTEIDGIVLCATVYNGVLYIGGNFTIAKNEEIYSLAKYENGQWQSLDVKNLYGSIRDMVMYKDELYVTGDFRSLNGVKNNGVMKYSDKKWSDAGLNSDLNAKGLFVNDDRLIAWGNGFRSNSGFSHSVSIYENNAWSSLPNIGEEPSSPNACSMHQGKIYTSLDNSLFYFDSNSYSWKNILKQHEDKSISRLFEHQGHLHAVVDSSSTFDLEDVKIIRLENDEVVNTDYPNLGTFDGSIRTVVSEGDNLYVGGDFHEWSSNSASLIRCNEALPISIGNVSSHISYRNAHSYCLANSITRYNGKYIIAGNFSFANDIYSPNLVYWDGEAFTPFEVVLQDGIKQVEVFEGELYAVRNYRRKAHPGLENYDLLKFVNNQWEGVKTPVAVDEINIINNRLFLNDEREYDSGNGGPYYLENNEWHELKKVEGSSNFRDYYYRDIQPYKGGYAMIYQDWPEDKEIVFLPDDDSEWMHLDTIDIRIDKFYSFNDNFYLIINHGETYRITNGEEKIIADDDSNEDSYFFTWKDQDFLCSFNGAWFKITEDNLERYNQLRIRDLEKINDNERLVVLQHGFHFQGDQRIDFHNIGILTNEGLSATIEQNTTLICDDGYVDFKGVTDYLQYNLDWKFPGGIPDNSSKVFPMIQYENPGTFPVSLTISNVDGDTIEINSQVKVEDCGIKATRANNYDNHWILGNNYSWPYGTGGFDFTTANSTKPVRHFPSSQLDNGSVIMSDIKGSLQFYSNGITINNMHNQIMRGSECFNINLYDYPLNYYIMNQSLMSIPAVNKPEIYYLFDLDPLSVEGQYWNAASNLSMNTIDMSKNDGEGEVVECNSIVIQDSLLNSTMQMTRHENGIDWWLIVGKLSSSEYYKVLITEDGVASVETDQWDRYYGTTFNGQSSFSPDGNFFAQIIREDQQVVLYKFNNATGELYDQKIYQIFPVDDTEYPQGCSFSPNSRYLYVSSLTQMRQLDLCDYENIEGQIIDSWDGAVDFVYPLYFAKQMLSPDQEILVASYGNGHKSLGVIKSPNNKGKACNFFQHSLELPENTNNNGDLLPIFPHFRNYNSHFGDCNLVGTSATSYTDDLVVFPNPISNNRVLRFSKKISGSLFDINGKELFTFDSIDYLDLHTIQAGAYFLKTGSGTKKIIVQ